MSDTIQRVAIVTGASAGLGQALALELGRTGWAVGVIARRKTPLRLLCDELKAEGRAAAYAIADVSDRESLAAAISKIEAELGAIELAIANAAVGIDDQLEPFDMEVVDETFRVNVFGAINTIAAVLPQMMQRGRGHIVGISSLGADRGLPGAAAYAASKAALSTYLESLRVSLKSRGIAVTTVCPGFIKTDMTAHNDFKMMGLLTPDEAARRIVKALRRRPAVYRFPLQTSLVMRLLKCMPDEILAKVVPQRAESDT